LASLEKWKEKKRDEKKYIGRADLREKGKTKKKKKEGGGIFQQLKRGKKGHGRGKKNGISSFLPVEKKRGGQPRSGRKGKECGDKLHGLTRAQGERIPSKREERKQNA